MGAQLGFFPKHLYKGCHHLVGPHPTVCTLADTYYKVEGVWTDGCNEGFVLDGLGKITFVGEDGTVCLFTGVSDLKSSKVARVTYGLYINGVLAVGAETPHDFEVANKIGSISITAFVEMQKYQYMEVYVKSDVAANTITHYTLPLTFLGDR